MTKSKLETRLIRSQIVLIEAIIRINSKHIGPGKDEVTLLIKRQNGRLFKELELLKKSLKRSK